MRNLRFGLALGLVVDIRRSGVSASIGQLVTPDCYALATSQQSVCRYVLRKTPGLQLCCMVPISRVDQMVHGQPCNPRSLCFRPSCLSLRR